MTSAYCSCVSCVLILKSNHQSLIVLSLREVKRDSQEETSPSYCCEVLGRQCVLVARSKGCEGWWDEVRGVDRGEGVAGQLPVKKRLEWSVWLWEDEWAGLFSSQSEPQEQTGATTEQVRDARNAPGVISTMWSLISMHGAPHMSIKGLLNVSWYPSQLTQLLRSRVLLSQKALEQNCLQLVLESILCLHWENEGASMYPCDWCWEKQTSCCWPNQPT